MITKNSPSFKVLKDLEPLLVPIASIYPDPNNVNKHNDFDLGEIKKSLSRYGQMKPILVSTEGWIVCGNGTYQAACLLGATEIAVVKVAPDDITEELLREFAVVDNKTARNSTFDDKKLSEYVKNIRIKTPTIVMPGFTNDEMLKFGNMKFDTVKPTIVNTPSPEPMYSEAWPQRAKYGEVWACGDHRVMCGDCLRPEHMSLLMKGERANMVWSDPPYGVSFESNHHKEGNPHGKIANDEVILDFIPGIMQYTADDCAFYICACHQNQEHWKELLGKTDLAYKNTIIWVKNNWSMGDLTGAYANQYEVVFFYVKGNVKLEEGRDRDVWTIDRVKPQGSTHATPKPIELPKRAMKNTSEAGDIVFDPFGGSMPTLFACEDEGRIARIMEIDVNHVNRALDTWASKYDEPILIGSVN